MSSFSGAVKIADLNDFIAPSQACVVSLESLKDKPPPSDFEEGVALQQRKHAKGGWSQTLPTKLESDPVKISLQDCLACSGCVTSAETVLLEHQSTDEFTARLGDPTVSVVVTVSGQSVASLAVAHNLTTTAAAHKLAAFFRGLGVKAVFDVSSGRDLALQETAAEFVWRFREEQSELQAQTYTKHMCHSTEAAERRASHSLSCTSGREGQPGGERHPIGRERQQRLPMLASACPGWVCYAEKAHGDYALPYISSAKSPQAIMGTLIKRFWAPAGGHLPESVYHCAVMPCYDKKLEASRSDLSIAGSDVAETDSVLTTIEVQQLLEAQGFDLKNGREEALDTLFGGKLNSLSGYPGGSGGYLEYTYRVAAEQLFGAVVPSGPLPMRVLRNTDFQETTLKVDGKPVLRFAAAYGFRNIQTLLRKVKQGLSQYDYVEVMACPSGCVNGGGQLRPQNGETAQQLVARVDSTYHAPEIVKRRPEESAECGQIYKQWIKGGAGSEAARKLLHTQYHKREKSVTSSVKDW